MIIKVIQEIQDEKKHQMKVMKWSYNQGIKMNQDENNDDLIYLIEMRKIMITKVIPETRDHQTHQMRWM